MDFRRLLKAIMLALLLIAIVLLVILIASLLASTIDEETGNIICMIIFFVAIVGMCYDIC